MRGYKRSPHDACLRVPLVLAGQGFDQATSLNKIVSLIDLTPTLLDAVQRLNLIGRPEYKAITAHLREELIRKIVSHGEPAPKIAVQWYCA